MLTVFAIAWRNTFFNAKRTLAALGGVTFSILLIFLQLAFLNGARKEVTLLYEYFDFDLAITSDVYQFMATAKPFDYVRLFQASVDPAVADTFRLNVSTARWLDPATEQESSLLVIGLDEKPGFIANPELARGLTSLTDSRSVILDRFSHADFGARKVGLAGRINGLDVEVTALFQLGLFFFAEGSVATSNANLVRLLRRPAHDVTLGLIKLKPGNDAAEVANRLRSSLPSDVVVLTRRQLFDREQDYFVHTKPIGIMFHSAVLVAFLVGVVILFQVLATELTNRMHEYATMKAMGFGPGFIYGIGITQNLIFISLSFLPASLASMGIFSLVYSVSKLPMDMTWSLFGTVFAMTVGMGIIAGMLALRKVRRADPAALF